MGTTHQDIARLQAVEEKVSQTLSIVTRNLSQGLDRIDNFDARLRPIRLQQRMAAREGRSGNR